MSLTINKIKTFSMGGVHPAENKFTADKSIEKLPVPKQVCTAGAAAATGEIKGHANNVALDPARPNPARP